MGQDRKRRRGTKAHLLREGNRLCDIAEEEHDGALASHATGGADRTERDAISRLRESPSGLHSKG